MEAKNENSRLITYSEAADILGVSFDTICHLKRKGVLNTRWVNHDVYIDRKSIEALLDTPKEIQEAKWKCDALLEKTKELNRSMEIELTDYRRLLRIFKEYGDNGTRSLREMLKKFVRYSIAEDRSFSIRDEHIVNGFIDGLDTRVIAKESSYSPQSVIVRLARIATAVVSSDTCKNYRQAYIEQKAVVDQLNEENKYLMKKYKAAEEMAQDPDLKDVEPLTKEEIQLFDFLSTPWEYCRVSLGVYNTIKQGLNKENLKAIDVARLSPFKLRKLKLMGPKKVMELEDLFESQGIKLPLDVNAIRPRYIIYLKQKVHKELEDLLLDTQNEL